jgi:anti-anti-sigma regulatory factor
VLKISIVDTRDYRRLRLEGRLVAPWTDELKRACEGARAELGNRKVVIDLTCLTAISDEGEKVLLELLSQGIRFRSSGVFTRLVMKHLSHKNLHISEEKKR